MASSLRGEMNEGARGNRPALGREPLLGIVVMRHIALKLWQYSKPGYARYVP